MCLFSLYIDVSYSYALDGVVIVYVWYVLLCVLLWFNGLLILFWFGTFVYGLFIFWFFDGFRFVVLMLLLFVVYFV